MKVPIKAFGIAKEIIGGSSIVVEIPAGSQVTDLLQLLKEQYPAFKELASLAIAVNATYADPEQEISTGDEVVIIPPVAGG
ncbi:MAG: MoaD/ThiS family protein [Saprospiraceae bacterium]